MYYFEFYLRAGGVRGADTVVILRASSDPLVAGDLAEEIRDIFPSAAISNAAPADAPVACDLLVVPVLGRHTFPFEDVVYDELDAIARAIPHAARARFVMLYRASWREVEVLPASTLPARLRSLGVEGSLIRLCRRSGLLRRLLRPHYPS